MGEKRERTEREQRENRERKEREKRENRERTEREKREKKERKEREKRERKEREKKEKRERKERVVSMTPPVLPHTHHSHQVVLISPWGPPVGQDMRSSEKGGPGGPLFDGFFFLFFSSPHIYCTVMYCNVPGCWLEAPMV